MSRNRIIKSSKHKSDEDNALSKMIKIIMKDGRKQTAIKIMDAVLDKIKDKFTDNPEMIFDVALGNVRPIIESKPCRVSGVTYNIPCEVSYVRSISLGMKMLCDAARAKKGMGMVDALYGEISDAYHSTGVSFKKKEQNAKMAEANRAFAHLRFFGNKKRVNSS